MPLAARPKGYRRTRSRGVPDDRETVVPGSPAGSQYWDASACWSFMAGGCCSIVRTSELAYPYVYDVAAPKTRCGEKLRKLHQDNMLEITTHPALPTQNSYFGQKVAFRQKNCRW